MGQAMKQENSCLNFIKGLACIGVVFMHSTFPYPYGQVISFLFKFAMPIFFFTSGYYAYYEDRDRVMGSSKRKAKRILKITVCAELLYFIIGLLTAVLSGDATSYVQNIQLNRFVYAIFMSSPLFNGTLWFLYALFGSYILLLLWSRTKLQKTGLVFILVVLIGHIVIRTILKIIEVPWYDAGYFRNAYIYGFPMLLLGFYIKKYENKLLKIPDKWCLFGIGGGTICMFGEYFCSRKVLDFYIGTMLVAICLFILSLKHAKNPVIPFIEYVGKKLSLYVYIVHIFVIDRVSQFKVAVGLEENVWMAWMAPVLALVGSVGVAIIVVEVFEKITIRKRY